MAKKCIQTKNIYGYDLVSGCRSLDDYDFHVFDKWECASSEWVRQACEHHEPLYAEIDPVLGIPLSPDKPTARPAFWLVWREGGGSTPHYKHVTELDARREAERLARQIPGTRFFVLPATEFAIVDLTPVAWRAAEKPPTFDMDEAPF